MGKIAAYYTIGGSGCIIILWLILLLYPGNWSYRNVGYAKVDVGLYWVRMRTSGALSHWMVGVWNTMSNCDSNLMEDSDETHSHISVSLLEFKECWCFFQSATQMAGAIPSTFASYVIKVQGCNELGRMQFGSFSMFIFGWISIIFMVIGCGCMFHYWTGQARKKLRNFIRISLSVSAGSVTFGLFIFVVTSFDSLQHLDLTAGWSNQADSANRTSWGYSFYFGVFAMLLTWIPLLMTEKFGKAGIFEEVHEVMHAEKKERMWEEVNNIQ